MNRATLTHVVQALLLPLVLSACGGFSFKSGEDEAAKSAIPPGVQDQKSAPAVRHGGGYYLDDGPLDVMAVDMATIPEAIPRNEPLHRFANRPYSVFGQDYKPMQFAAGFRQQGVASWYGRRYHGQKTASGETYDMFTMTAAHPTLPIPSYARVTRPDSGKSVVVRINDRGPFLHGRVIDLSYAAAWKLDLVNSGSGTVTVESVLPGKAVPVLAAVPPPRSVPESKPGLLKDIEGQGGHYLQLGAFSSPDNAESLRARLSRDLGDLGSRVSLSSIGSLYRVQLGPWKDVAEARRIAEQLRQTFDLPSVLVK